jgi:hypothetical protein
MRRALDLLTRLERHALDERRLRLTRLVGELTRRRAQRAQLQERIAREHETAFELPGGPRPLAAYLRVARLQEQILEAAAAQLEAAVAAAEAGLQAQLRRWKALDLAGQALRQRETDALLRAARIELEGSAALRAAAQNSGASVTASPSSAGPNLIWQDSRELSRTSNASSSIMLSSEFAASNRGSHAAST